MIVAEEGLLLVERYILETLAPEGKKFIELKKETRLPAIFLKNLLDGLLERRFLRFQAGFYFIDQESLGKLALTINSWRNIKSEVKELVESMINFHFEREPRGMEKGESLFKLKKVSMKREELTILKSLLLNVETYLDNLLKDQRNLKEDEREEIAVCERQVVLWGQIPYPALLKGNFQGM